MKMLPRLTLALTLIGLALLPAMESWRSGAISAGVNIGLVWVFGVGCLFVLIRLVTDRK